MPAIEITMPKFGLTMLEGQIGEWLKREGDSVGKGEAIVEIATEKIVNSVESPCPGTLSRILLQEGETAPVGTPIAILEAAEGFDGGETGGLQAGMVPCRMGEASGGQAGSGPAGQESSPRQRVSGAARRLAEEAGISVESIKGTGPAGRVVREDVLRAVGELKAKAGGDEAREPLSDMRRTIARRLQECMQSTVQWTVTMEADVTEMEILRLSRDTGSGHHLSPTVYMIKAAAIALAAYPEINVGFTGTEIIRKREINIGCAVDLEQGLIVPVIRNAGGKSLAEISDDLKRLTERARSGRLSFDDTSGGTFTVSNLGMFGVDVFTPILNPPESAILGVGRIVKKPVYVGDRLEPRQMTVLSLTTDHRVIDGGPASRFLRTIKEVIEQPRVFLAD